MRRSLFIAALFLSVASAQFSTTFSITNGATTVTFVSQPTAPDYAFSGAPYSAKQSQQHVQTTAVGAHLTQKPTFVSIWQDVEGRQRTQRDYAIAGGNFITVAQILDPVEGVVYVLDPAEKVAHRVKVTPTLIKIHSGSTGPASNIPPHTTTNKDGSTFTTEPLGTETIAGFNAVGFRTTMHYPAGSSLGNDQPLDSVTEVWNAPQLGTSVLMKMNDPRYGTTTMTLSDIVPGEPDPSLLRPPSGYRIVDETGPFSLTVTK